MSHPVACNLHGNPAMSTAMTLCRWSHVHDDAQRRSLSAVVMVVEAGVRTAEVPPVCAVPAASAWCLLHDCKKMLRRRSRQRDHLTLCRRRGITSCGTGARCARQQTSRCTSKSTCASNLRASAREGRGAAFSRTSTDNPFCISHA